MDGPVKGSSHQPCDEVQVAQRGTQKGLRDPVSPDPPALPPANYHFTYPSHCHFPGVP